ncbi:MULTISPECIES: glycosyltransferase family 4 protein [unclassified Microbacterium]|uniref:glycosyltransferase family 4 protein n=1 Tax=unclassified Microbacterium TaxID=2609290 RepID=UPI001DC174A2|nr:glycosyltransferase family 4 protein [Microbacterium sp. Bi121]CAH0133455.1 D-inositol-3-phosphate glycosyltransferase [Microbacterium sp. Bi121]
MRRPIRALIASRLFPPEVSAGAFRLGALARSLSRREAEVTVLTTTPPSTAPTIADPPGVHVRRWPVLRDAGGNVRGYVQYMSFDIPLMLRVLTRRFDVAVSESPPTTGLVVVLAGILRRKPVVYYAADVWTDGVISMGAPKAVITIMKMLERTVLARSARIISVSDEVTERLIALGADRGRVTTVGNGVDTDVFTPEVEPAASDRYFVYTGTMSEWQQPEIFVRGFAQISDEVPDVRLRFFGQGAMKEQLQRIAEELVPGRVEFGGVVTPEESASWIRGAVASLVSIVPGIGYDFARPTKTYAAAAVGTPVLFAGPATGSELVRSAQLGHAVDFNPVAVAAAMRELIAETEDGTRERLRAQRSSWARANVSLTAVAARVSAVVSQAALGTAGKLGDASDRPADRDEGQAA